MAVVWCWGGLALGWSRMHNSLLDHSRANAISINSSFTTNLARGHFSHF